MKRKALKTHVVCGRMRVQPSGTGPQAPAGSVPDAFRASARRVAAPVRRLTALALFALIGAVSGRAVQAQDLSVLAQPGSILAQPGGLNQNYFKPVPGGPFGSQPKINSAAPLYPVSYTHLTLPTILRV